MINKISPVSQVKIHQNKKVQKHTQSNFSPSNCVSSVPFLGNCYGAKINRANIGSPLDQLIYQASKQNGPSYDTWTEEHTISGFNRPDKKWVSADPSDALKRSLNDAINSNLTLIYGKDIPKTLPKDVKTPDYGDNWARHANYIEINNRALGSMQGDRTNSSILNTIKLLPLIPPSHDKWANCVLISQLYPNIWGDGWNNNGENSLYGIKLENERFSDNIGWMKVGDKVFTPEEQIEAFNNLAHLRGLKTSFRMLISEDQIKLGDSGQFRWNNPEHVEAFIIACCKGIEKGFDGIFFDSIKHVGGYDWGHYAGVGAVPSYEQMQYIFDEVRKRTGRCDIGFSGEKAEADSNRYKNMGLNAGASQMNADDINNVKHSAQQQKNCREFAWGPVVSDDNDEGSIGYNQRLARITSSLYGYNNPHDKLPSFMQMHDLFPLNWETNTHNLMMENRNFSLDDEIDSHFENLFAHDNEANQYRNSVNNEFTYCYAYGAQ